jgi:hypothetical protein
MPVTIPEKPGEARGGLAKRLGWFVGLYVLGVGAVGAVAFILRLWIRS